MFDSDSPNTAAAAAATHDRRRRRSEDPITALHYQLSFARAEAELEALVLVDDSGCLVAGAGAWPLCEELAAYAPLLAYPSAIQNDSVGSSLAAMARETEIRTMMIDGVEAMICGRGTSAARGATIARAAAGCRRILGGAEA